jgi:hypothetical protein
MIAERCENLPTGTSRAHELANPIELSRRRSSESGRQVRLTSHPRSKAEVFVYAARRKSQTRTPIQEDRTKLEKEGRYKGREEEVAARIVNKQRAKSGETKGTNKKDTRKESSKR